MSKATSKEPTREEQLGAAVVTTVLQCNARFIDNGLSKSTQPIVDYELDLSAGEHASLEISRITDEKLRDLSASAVRLDWNLTTTRYSWALGVARNASLKQFRNECNDLLAVLEEHDVLVCSDSELPEGEARGAAQRLLHLGVLTAIVYDRPGDRRVWVHPSWPWTSYHPGKELNSRASLESHANKNKFLARGRARGHLFLWADELATSIAFSLSWEAARRYIDTPPELPLGVTTVWVASNPFTTEARGQPVWPFSSKIGDEPIDVVRDIWRVEPPKRWEYLGDIEIKSICTPERVTAWAYEQARELS